MERLVIEGAAGHLVDGRADEAERVAGLLVGKRDQPGPEGRSSTGAALRQERVGTPWRDPQPQFWQTRASSRTRHLSRIWQHDNAVSLTVIDRHLLSLTAVCALSVVRVPQDLVPSAAIRRARPPLVCVAMGEASPRLSNDEAGATTCGGDTVISAFRVAELLELVPLLLVVAGVPPPFPQSRADLAFLAVGRRAVVDAADLSVGTGDLVRPVLLCNDT